MYISTLSDVTVNPVYNNQFSLNIFSPDLLLATAVPKSESPSSSLPDPQSKGWKYFSILGFLSGMVRHKGCSLSHCFFQ